MTQCEHHKAPGEPIEIGDMLGCGQDPEMIAGRICGFIKGDTTEVIFRKYRTQDEKWPSGGFYSRRMPMIWPHIHFDNDSDCTRLLETEP